MIRQFSAAADVEHRIDLPDGRMLAVSEFGSADGVPVVFIAGAACSRAMNAYGPAARDRGVRMITFDRPGLGDSSYDAGKSLESVTADLAFALDRLGIDRPLAVANSQGAPFGLAGAASGIFARTALVSPADEIAHPDTRALLTGDAAGFVTRVLADPEGSAAFLAGFDAATMFDFILSGSSESDAPVFRDAEFAALFRRSLEQALADGGRGYAQDTILATSPWGVEAPDPGTLQIWFGSDDTSHSPDRGELLAARLRAQRRVVDGVGGSLLWTHTAEILDALLGAVASASGGQPSENDEVSTGTRTA